MMKIFRAKMLIFVQKIFSDIVFKGCPGRHPGVSRRLRGTTAITFPACNFTFRLEFELELELMLGLGLELELELGLEVGLELMLELEQGLGLGPGLGLGGLELGPLEMMRNIRVKMLILARKYFLI